jgi:RNA polymerase sigma factor (sigma-70 family)
MELGELAKKCAEATQQFFRELPHDNRYCFELFRRAIVEQNKDAWNLVYEQYQPLVAHWVKAHPKFAKTDEDVENFVQDAFMSMWRALTPDKFERFPRLQGLLTYLKACAKTAIDLYLRKVPPNFIVPDELTDEIKGLDSLPSHEEMVTRQMARAGFLRTVLARLKTEQERIIIQYRFYLDLRPREIFERFPDLFRDVAEVHRVKQNLLERLYRDPDLAKFFGESKDESE